MLFILLLGEETANDRTYFFGALYALKFSLQAQLQQKLGCSVILGPTDRKVNYGVRNDGVARFYQVGELVDFLKSKKYGAMLFNLWFDASRSGLEKRDFVSKALPLIERTVLDAVDWMRGIQPLPFNDNVL